MSTSINVQVNGQTVTIQSGEKLEDVKKKLANPADTIFEGVDANSNGKLEAGELQKLKTNLENNNYTVEVAEDGKTPRRAYNDAMQNLRNSYNAETLGGYFKGDDADLHVVKKGETLYTIVKKQLAEEGLPTDDFRAINNRIAQIANLNNINDVNNIKEGVKLKVKLTDEAIAKVKENNNDSAKAFNGTATAAGDDWTKGTSKKGQADGVANDKVVDYKKQPTLVDGKTSTIAVTKNGLNMGKGVPVDKDGNVLKSFKDPKYKQGGFIMKYTNKNHDPETMFQKSFGSNCPYPIFRNVKLSADSVENLKKLEAELWEIAGNIKSDRGAKETPEVKAKRQATGLANLKLLIEKSGGNEQIVRNAAALLQSDKYLNIESDECKAFANDLLLTRNANVVKSMTTDDDGEVTMSAFEKNREAHETLAGMYQEIREKEKAGEKLSADEVKLKDALVNTKCQDGFKIEADEANHVNEKYLSYGEDGRLAYTTVVGNNSYWASDEKLLDEFVNKLKAADTDEKKTALFKEYANTKDVELANCLLLQAKELKAKDEDIKTVINANGMEVLYYLDSSANSDWSDDIKNAMLARIKDIYTKEKGNLENAAWLGVADDWINKLPDDQQEAVRTEIAETYFEKTTTKDEEGNDKTEYTFNPTRRPTKEEMNKLLDVVSDDMTKALINYTKIEDMGKGQYNEAIENRVNSSIIASHYGEMVETMEDEKDVIDFIDNKMVLAKAGNMPFDAILDKFPDSKAIKDKLIEFTLGQECNTISPEHRLDIVKAYCKDDGNGNYTFDKSLLPKGATVQNVIKALPEDCTKGEAQKLFKAIFKTLDFSNLDMVLLFNNCSFTMDNEIKKKLRDFILNPENKGTAVYNSLVTMSEVQNVLSAQEKQKIFDQSSKAVQRDLLWNNPDDSKHVVQTGEKLDNIIKGYLTNHLDKFPALKKSVDGDKDKKKWTEKRINEALNDYVKDFREDIAKDLGLESASKLKQGDVLDLSKIKWDKHQPNWFNYNIYY